MRKTNSRRSLFAGVIAVVSSASLTLAGSYFSNSNTDGAGQNNAQTNPRGTVLGGSATLEGWFLFTEQFNAMGTVYCEWALNSEDKHFRLGANGFNTHMFGLNTGDFNVSLDLGPYVWHHVAYVYDGSEERLYVDGSKLAARPAGGDIRDYPVNDNPSFNDGYVGLGRYRRGTEGLTNAFTGYMETFRISLNARYSGDSITVPAFGNFVSDSQTALLFNFEEPSSSLTMSGVGVYPVSVQRGRTSPPTIVTIGSPDLVSTPSFTLGDATLDGHVNFNDLLIVAQNYGASLAVTWTKGDFNNDHVVEFADMLILAQHYESNAPAVDVSMLDESLRDDWLLAWSTIPEPTALAVSAPLLLSCRIRRRARL